MTGPTHFRPFPGIATPDHLRTGLQVNTDPATVQEIRSNYYDAAAALANLETALRKAHAQTMGREKTAIAGELETVTEARRHLSWSKLDAIL